MTTDQDQDLTRFDAYRRSGDPALRNAIVERHVDLARAFARRYRGRGVATEDLEQVAAVALIGAVERYDPELGVRFSTFAGRSIDGELKRHFRDRAWSVRVPRRQQELGLAVRAEVDRLSKKLSRSPTIAEVATAVGASVDEVLAAMEAAQAFQADSLDAPVDDTTPVAAAEALQTVDLGPLAFERHEEVVGLLAQLPERERQIVELRFFAEMNQRDIATAVGVSQMHVSRLLRSALATLRDLSEADHRL